MSTAAFRRDLSSEVAKHANSATPEERIKEALRLGEMCFEVYLAALPPGTTREEAPKRAERSKAHGRRVTRIGEHS